MRTTLNIDDKIFHTVKSIAQSTSKSMGEVVSDLLRRSLEEPGTPVYEKDLPVFHVGEDARPITLKDVKKDEDGY
jgi:negative regulator of replication initiation